MREDVLYKTYVEAIKEITDNAAEVIETIRSGLAEECAVGTQERLHENEERIIQLQEATLEAHKAKQRMELSAADYAAKVKENSEKMKALEAERDAAAGDANRYTQIKAVIDAFESSIKNGSISNPDDYAVMRSVVEQIIVRKDSMEIEFKCGASITKEYVR